MKFLFPLALLIAVGVVGPIVAHLLRRRKPEEQPFPPARLVPTAPPLARRRANLEDRPLLLLRALAVALLAMLAASPLVRCSSLSLDRRGGSSVALVLVIDDSMSMRAALADDARRDGAKSRFDLALVAAQEIAGSLRSGDVTAIVLAGSPARVMLAPTGEPSNVRAALELLAREGPSDRATDLDGAVALAAASLRDLPHVDRRVVLLSDLADGNASGTPLAPPDLERLELAAPLEALTKPSPTGNADCALLAASPDGEASLRARVVCALGGTPVGKRAIEVRLVAADDAGRTVVGTAAFPQEIPPAPATFDVVVPLDRSKLPGASGSNGTLDPQAGKPTLTARIVGAIDAIAADDEAPVLGVASTPLVGVVVGEGGALDEVVATGGPPLLERALGALGQGSPAESAIAVRPLPSIPDRDLDLAPFAALAIDDPPGLGPESREALRSWMEQGGVLLLALGPRAASPPLGQTMGPMLEQLPKWDRLDLAGKALGVDPNHAGPLGASVVAPTDLAAKGRARFDPADLAHVVVTSAFTDGAPLLVTRAIGRGEVWMTTLPFAPDVSDLPLRPSFLAMLDAFLDRAEDRGAGERLEAGKLWLAGPDDQLEVAALDLAGVVKPGPPLPVERSKTGIRVAPREIGAYLVTTTPKGGAARREVRAVSPVAREVDLAPRALVDTIASGAKTGLQRTTKELAPTLAWLLFALFGGELVLRIVRLLTTPKDRDEDAPTSAETR